jgi:FkbM family methyltransferase
MKSILKKIFHYISLDLSYFKRSPYEYLLDCPRYKEITVNLLGREFAIADPLSFYWSYREIFIDDIYKFQTSTNTPTILDCGSNYGTSIAYFKALYPDAKIIGIEPDPEIFKLLSSNIQKLQYKDVQLINKAVSTSTESIDFYHEGADGGRIFRNSSSTKTYSTTPIHLDELINGPVDFLKMDIEGSETEVLCSSKKLKYVDQIFIEYHSFQDSQQTLNEILEKLTENNFRYYIHTQFCSPRPLTEKKTNLGMDLQLNIFANRAKN